MITNVDLKESTNTAQYQQSLAMLKYQDKPAYKNKKINELIIKKFSQESILAVITHYDEWILYGLTPDDILYIVQQYGEKGVELLNTLNAVAEKLLNLTDTSVSINHFKNLLDILKFDAFFLIKLLLNDNDSRYFEALCTLIVWIKSLPDESSDARNGKFSWSQILVFLDIGTYDLVVIMSNMGPSRAIKIIQQLFPWIKKWFDEKRGLTSFKKMFMLNLGAQQFMVILENVGHAREIENLKKVSLWSKTLSSVLSSVKSDQGSKYKNALDEALAILGINTARFVTILLSDDGLINFKLLSNLIPWVKTFSSKDPKYVFARILTILGLDLDQLIKIMANIDNLNAVINLHYLKDLKSLKGLSILLCWVRKLVEDSNFTMSPMGCLARILAISNLNLEGLLQALITHSFEKNIEIFKDLIEWSICISANISLSDAFVLLELKKGYILNYTQSNDLRVFKELKDRSLRDLAFGLDVKIEELNAWQEPANPETFLSLDYDASDASNDERLNVEEAISSWYKLDTDNKQSKKRKAQKAKLNSMPLHSQHGLPSVHGLGFFPQADEDEDEQEHGTSSKRLCINGRD